MEKIKVSRKVADALDYLLATELYKENRSKILKAQVHNEDAWHCSTPAEGLNGVDIMTLATALVNGYEADMTPEERLEALYSKHEKQVSTSFNSYSRGITDGILHTLATLDIKVKGVNLHDD